VVAGLLWKREIDVCQAITVAGFTFTVLAVGHVFGNSHDVQENGVDHGSHVGFRPQLRDGLFLMTASTNAVVSSRLAAHGQIVDADVADGISSWSIKGGIYPAVLVNDDATDQLFLCSGPIADLERESRAVAHLLADSFLRLNQEASDGSYAGERLIFWQQAVMLTGDHDADVRSIDQLLAMADLHPVTRAFDLDCE
jgi:hypothetical protein